MQPFVIDGCTVRYEMIGAGPIVALTPGGRAPGEALRPLAQRLSERYRVLLWDRRNTGAADLSFDGEGSEQELWADDLARLLKHLKLAPAWVGGGSAGCRVSLLTAIRHPEVVKGLVLWSASGGAYGSQVLGYDYHVPFIRAAQAGGMEAVARTPFFAERIQANPANRARLLAMDPERFVQVMKRWYTFFYPDGRPVVGVTEQQLRAIRVPTLIFEGNDDIHPKEGSDALAGLIPGAKLVPSAWTRQEWMDIYVGKRPGPLMETLYPRLAEPMLEFLATTPLL